MMINDTRAFLEHCLHARQRRLWMSRPATERVGPTALQVRVGRALIRLGTFLTGERVELPRPRSSSAKPA